MLCQLAKSALQGNGGKFSCALKNQIAQFAVSAGEIGGGPNGTPAIVDEPAPAIIPGHLEKWRNAVIQEYVHGDKVAKGFGQWQRPGMTVLNDYMKGMRPHEMTVLTGPTGFGKTTFICEYALDLCTQGVRTLFCSFEMPIARILKVMVQQHAAYVNPDLPFLWDRKPHGCDPNEHAKYVDYWFKKFMEECNLQMFEQSGSLRARRDVVDQMQDWVEKMEIQHCVVDNLHFLQGMKQMEFKSNMDKFQVQDYLVSKFRKLATETGCHVTLVAHPRKEADGVLHINSIYGSAKISQEADNVLIIQRAHKRHDDTFAKFLHIVKNRYAGDRVDTDRILMEFRKESFSHCLIDTLMDGSDETLNKEISARVSSSVENTKRNKGAGSSIKHESASQSIALSPVQEEPTDDNEEEGLDEAATANDSDILEASNSEILECASKESKSSSERKKKGLSKARREEVELECEKEAKRILEHLEGTQDSSQES